MKKFLPLVIFILVLASGMLIQVGWNKITRNEQVIKEVSNYHKYESLLLNSEFKTLEGKTFRVSQMNEKVIIFNFWASWCKPCLDEMPSMVELKKKFKKNDLAIVAINADEVDQIKNIKQTLKTLKIKNEFIIVPDSNYEILEKFDVTALPVSIVLAQGKVVRVHTGPVDFSSGEYEEMVNNWINK